MTWDAQGLAGPPGDPLSQNQRERERESRIKGQVLLGTPRDLQAPWVTR